MQTRLYERLGGACSVSAAVEKFYEKIWADATLVDYFEGIDRTRLKAHQRAFIMTVVGGPQVYTGRGMPEAHAGLGVTDAAFDQVVAHLASTLSELGVDETTISELIDALAPLRADIVEPSLPHRKSTKHPHVSDLRPSQNVGVTA